MMLLHIWIILSLEELRIICSHYFYPFVTSTTTHYLYLLFLNVSLTCFLCSNWLFARWLSSFLNINPMILIYKCFFFLIFHGLFHPFLFSLSLFLLIAFFRLVFLLIFNFFSICSIIHHVKYGIYAIYLLRVFNKFNKIINFLNRIEMAKIRMKVLSYLGNLIVK